MPNVNVAHNATNIRYNMFYGLEEIAMSKSNPEQYLKFLTDEAGGSTPAEYPYIFRAASNNPSTFFILDLNPPNTPNTCDPTIKGRNYDIYDIQFVGASDRTLGGIKGITIELYRDQPNEAATYKAFDGVSYDPVFRYILPTDNVSPPPIIVAPPASCKFSTTLDGIKVLKKPAFLQSTSPPLSQPDTSGGVFGFSSVINGIGSAWNAILPIDPATLASYAKNNAKKSDEVVHNILNTMSATTKLLDTNMDCKNPEVLNRMMMLYNIKKAPSDTASFGFEMNTMKRILKSGQSTPNTCDILFENLNEFYDDYTVDIKDAIYKVKSVKTARFKFNTVNNVTGPVPDAASIVYDISSNALGLMTDAAALTPVYSGRYSSLDCRNAAVLAAVKSAISHGPVMEGTTKIETQFKTVVQSFQTTPMSCEYKIQKLEKYTSTKTNQSYVSKPITTFAKAIFTLAADGYTTVFSSAKEYDPKGITVSQDKTKTFVKGVEMPLPSIIYYDTSKGVSTARVITGTQNM